MFGNCLPEFFRNGALRSLKRIGEKLKNISLKYNEKIKFKNYYQISTVEY